MNLPLLKTSLDKYAGEEISHFEDEFGRTLEDLHMLDHLVIVFRSGRKIHLAPDWRGSECYFSQRGER